MNKQRYHHGNLKEELIDITLEMIKTLSVQDITLREIGSKLGTSRTAIYRHFKNKDELIKQVILSGFTKLDKALEPIFINTEISLLNKLHDMGLAYIKFGMENPNLYRLLFGGHMSQQRKEVCLDERKELFDLLSGDVSTDSMNNGQENSFHKLVSIILQAQEDNILKNLDSFLMATGIWSLLHGLVSLAIDGHFSIEKNIYAIYEINNQMLIEGFKL